MSLYILKLPEKSGAAKLLRFLYMLGKDYLYINVDKRHILLYNYSVGDIMTKYHTMKRIKTNGWESAV